MYIIIIIYIHISLTLTKWRVSCWMHSIFFHHHLHHYYYYHHHRLLYYSYMNSKVMWMKDQNRKRNKIRNLFDMCGMMGLKLPLRLLPLCHVDSFINAIQFLFYCYFSLAILQSNTYKHFIYIYLYINHNMIFFSFLTHEHVISIKRRIQFISTCIRFFFTRKKNTETIYDSYHI